MTYACLLLIVGNLYSYYLQPPIIYSLLFNTTFFVWYIFHQILYYQDFVVPIAVIIIFFLIRTLLPAFLLEAGITPKYTMIAHDQWFVAPVWENGIRLFFVGAAASIFGWQCLSGGIRSENFEGGRSINLVRLERSAFVFFLIALLFYLYFFAINFGSPSAIFAVMMGGQLRAGEIITQGTTRFSYLSQHFMFWSSILLGILLRYKGKKWYVYLLPAFLVFILRVPFGGRVQAATPLLLTLIGAYYVGQGLSFRSIKVGHVFRMFGRFFVILALGSFVSFLMLVYRNQGLGKVSENINTEEFQSFFVNTGLWYELGFISPFSYAVQFGAGCYDVPVGRMLFSGYTAFFLGLTDVKKPGGFFTEKIIGRDFGWGIHTGIIVDLYVYSGLIMLIAGCLAFGLLLKLAYARLIRKNTNVIKVLFYIYLFNHFFWAQFESVVGFTSAIYESLIFLMVILFFSLLFVKRSGLT